MVRAEDIRPSSAGVWAICSGNAAMRAAFPDAPEDADTEVCEDGIACHWLAKEIWDGRQHAEDTLSPNQRVITEEMFDAVDMYHDLLRSWKNVVPVLEVTIAIDRILRGMRGTPDAWAYDPDKKTLYIADLKFGFRFVEVFECLQLACYGAGLIDLLQIANDPELIIEFVIVQPRSFHREGQIRTWRVYARDLLPLFAMLAEAAQRAMHHDPVYVPNPGCLDCPGRHACMAYQNAALSAVELAYGGSPHELTAEQLGTELRLLLNAEKRLKGRITGLMAQAESIARKGQHVKYFTLEPTYAREAYREDGKNLILAMEQYFQGAVLRKPPQPISPAQARKVIPPSVVAVFTHKPSTGVRLKLQDPNQARKAFSPQPPKR